MVFDFDDLYMDDKESEEVKEIIGAKPVDSEADIDDESGSVPGEQEEPGEII